MENIENIDRWLQTTVVYGLAFVFLSIFCAIILWVVWQLSVNAVGGVKSLREWVPRWFAAQTESHLEVRGYVTQLRSSHSEQMDFNRRTVSALEAIQKNGNHA